MSQNKSESESETPKLGRRDFLKVVGVAGVASALPTQATRADDAMKMPMPAPAAGSNAPVNTNTGFLFFDADEGAVITAMVDTLIPADATGPGGVEAGVHIYIDRQLGGAYGSGARLNLQGPFSPGTATPSQGYQLPYTPAELIKTGLADFAAYLKQAKGNTFDNLQAADRDAVLKDLDGNKITFATVPSKVFFDHIYNLVQEGYFGDPIYGGNAGKSVWKMIGFPGVAGMYTQLIEQYRNKPYSADPQSIQDFA
jgi:gluconate 2-dehydrogenase gamma chain